MDIHMLTEVYFKLDKIQYEWHGYFGCQLRSYEFNRKWAGTTRELKFDNETIEIHIWRTGRRAGNFLVPHYWAVSTNGTIEEYRLRIENLRTKLKALV